MVRIRGRDSIIEGRPLATLRFARSRHKRPKPWLNRSEEHTSELQSRLHLVCRLLLEKKNKNHAQAETKVLQFVLDLIERLLAAVSILQHVGLGLLGKLPDRGDVRIVQAISCSHPQLD